MEREAEAKYAQKEIRRRRNFRLWLAVFLVSLFVNSVLLITHPELVLLTIWPMILSIIPVVDFSRKSQLVSPERFSVHKWWAHHNGGDRLSENDEAEMRAVIEEVLSSARKGDDLTFDEKRILHDIIYQALPIDYVGFWESEPLRRVGQAAFAYLNSRIQNAKLKSIPLPI